MAKSKAELESQILRALQEIPENDYPISIKSAHRADLSDLIYPDLKSLYLDAFSRGGAIINSGHRYLFKTLFPLIYSDDCIRRVYSPERNSAGNIQPTLFYELNFVDLYTLLGTTTAAGVIKLIDILAMEVSQQGSLDNLLTQLGYAIDDENKEQIEELIDILAKKLIILALQEKTIINPVLSLLDQMKDALIVGRNKGKLKILQKKLLRASQDRQFFRSNPGIVLQMIEQIGS